MSKTRTLKKSLASRYAVDLSDDDLCLITASGSLSEIVAEYQLTPPDWCHAIPAGLYSRWECLSTTDRTAIVSAVKALTPVPDTDAPTPYNDQWRSTVRRLPKEQIVDMLRAALIHNAARSDAMMDMRHEAFIQSDRVTKDDLVWMVSRLYYQWRNDADDRRSFDRFENDLRFIFREATTQIETPHEYPIAKAFPEVADASL